MTKNDGGPAYPAKLPQAYLVSEDGKVSHPLPPQFSDGMSLRDWFAGMALQGLLSSPSGYVGATGIDSRVVMAYKYADAMLAERGKE